ncbi:MAG: hypothetical protein KAX26_16150, partial [Anaerolineae bacterium]|nr:hypothetical protein [Anaerolineae bacterium]
MTNWHITETEFNPEALHHKETVFTIGNGYLGTRGAFEEGYPDAWPVTLVHGLFDDAPQVYTELANVPNWLPFVLFVNGERFGMDRGTVLSYRRDLDLQTGVLTRTVRWRSPAGHTVDLAIERFASLADPHLLCIRYRVTAPDIEDEDESRLGRSNFARPAFLRQAQDRLPDPGQKRGFGNPLGATLGLEFRAGLDGHVYNASLVHWRLVEQGNVGERGVYLHVRTRSSDIGLCEACHLAVSGGEDIAYANLDCECAPTVVARLTLRPGEQVVADKL